MESAAPDIASLIKLVAGRLLDEVDALLADIDAAIFEVAPILAEDPTLAAESRASSRANVLRWLTAMQLRPGEPVSRDVPLETLDLARTLVRRGAELDALVQSYRRGQNVSWRRWMDLAAANIPSRGDLVEVLQVSSALMYEYVDRVLDAVIKRMQQERQDLLSGALARRAETIRLLLDGAPISAERAGRQLTYDLTGRHVAAVLWSDPPGEVHGMLEQAAGTLSMAACSRPPLTLPAGTRTLWAWLPVRHEPDWQELRDAMAASAPRVRAVLGPLRDGVTGFRRSHAAALAAQRLLAGTPDGEQLTAYHEIEAVALVSQDEERMAEFITSTLGPLCGADPAHVTLRSTLRVYLDEGGNAPRAAERLHTHRNTVLHRVARAETLLGYRVTERRLAVSLALELLHRLGSRALPR
ncbi:PucR family transcriptional regulator [Streptomyces sp. NRRL S-813]|uniref:PucR family transcriptional regulator n=1 Tax=Streptomyces sp. NRRL S-813 TaxID=1463919 RepID=UPI0004BF27BD|nr:helix-turn-helix domain-containing protein [Streptomyces sp. NRRL S-813]